MVDEQQIARIRWRCRRGMLELDVMLEKYFDHHFRQLSEQQKKEFERLLETPDQTLFDWFLGKTAPEDESFKRIVDKIRAVN